MAKTVYSTEEVELQNGAVVTLKPLNIFLLRKFQQELAKLMKSEDETTTLDQLVEMTKICLSQDLPELVEDQEAFEKAMDQTTMYKVIEICGGINFTDPNLLAAAASLQD